MAPLNYLILFMYGWEKLVFVYYILGTKFGEVKGMPVLKSKGVMYLSCIEEFLCISCSWCIPRLMYGCSL